MQFLKKLFGSSNINNLNTSFESPIEWYRRGSILHEKNKFGDAVKAFDRAIELSKKQEDLHLIAIGAKAVCLKDKGSSFTSDLIPDEMSDSLDDITCHFIAFNISATLVSDGHEAKVYQEKYSKIVRATISSYNYKLNISTFMGKVIGSGDRLEDLAGIREKAISITDTGEKHPDEDYYLAEILKKGLLLELPIAAFDETPSLIVEEISKKTEEQETRLNEKVECSQCLKEILSRTANRTGGLCMPCWKKSYNNK